ncbi:myosin light chain kinase A [Drosophila takahashii]|uniref:myosin light chain kinase A n=1 Tax=Drosophila takahashii TaxID=29030 RepID=UPI001CF825CE|nr:serine/threonine-protein kinase DCLK2 [Drosophila takahashii]
MSEKDKFFQPKRLQPSPLKALRVCFLRNGDRHFKGVNMAVSRGHFKDFQALLQSVTEALRRHVVLRSAISLMCLMDGSPLVSLGSFSEGDMVICCCKYEELVNVDYTVNRDFLRQKDSHKRRHLRRLCGKSLKEIIPTDLPKAISLYIGQLQALVQTTRTLIYCGMARATRMPCIVKMVNKQYMDYNCEDPYIEAEVHRRLQSHPNIVDLMYSVEEERYMYMVLEFLEFDVGEMLQKKGSVSEAMAKSVVRGTAAGLAHMHQLQIIHRDIKPDNLLIRYSDKSETDISAVKIADFGLATYYRGSKLYACCGTPCFMAPELIAGSGYDYQVDCWALGVTLFHLLYGKTPFANPETMVVDIYAAIMSGEPSYPEEKEGVLSSEAEQLIDWLLIRDPSKRLTITEVNQNWFLAQ